MIKIERSGKPVFYGGGKKQKSPKKKLPTKEEKEAKRAKLLAKKAAEKARRKEQAIPKPPKIKRLKGGRVDSRRYASISQRLQILKRDNYECRYCGCEVSNETANMDHIYPWKHGGANSLRESSYVLQAMQRGQRQ